MFPYFRSPLCVYLLECVLSSYKFKFVFRYTLVEEGPMRRMSGHAGVSVEDDESESVVRTSSDQRAEELQVFWSYIVNMLINLESLPLDRIFQVCSPSWF